MSRIISPLIRRVLGRLRWLTVSIIACVRVLRRVWMELRFRIALALRLSPRHRLSLLRERLPTLSRPFNGSRL